MWAWEAWLQRLVAQIHTTSKLSFSMVWMRKLSSVGLGLKVKLRSSVVSQTCQNKAFSNTCAVHQDENRLQSDNILRQRGWTSRVLYTVFAALPSKIPFLEELLLPVTSTWCLGLPNTLELPLPGHPGL
jgi:hypothetical protein